MVALVAPAEVSDPLTDLLRSGARRLIEAAVTAEFEEYLGAFEEQKLANGRRRVVRNGHPSRTTDSDRDRRGRRAGAEGAQPVWSGGAVPICPGAAGDNEEYYRLMRELNVPAETLMALKKGGHTDFIRERGLKTDLADAKYGPDWLDEAH